MKIDLNCDLGESFGRYTLGDDEAIMPLISSANIACGAHAGDPSVMEKTVRLAARWKVGIGAHPGYADIQGFGRRHIDLSPDEVESLVLYQIGALAAFVRGAGAELVHVKPHGALYHQAARNRPLARAIAMATARFSTSLVLVGLAGSLLIEEAEAAGLPAANEGFPDRAYEADGTLRPRRMPGAILSSPEQAAAQALRLAVEGIAMNLDGEPSRVRVQTLCVHGDNPAAPQVARAIRDTLTANRFELETLSRFLSRPSPPPRAPV